MSVFMISPQEAKDESPLDANVDEKNFRQAILFSQDNYIQHIVGTGIFNELKTQITDETLTVLNTTLLNTYIRPALLHYVLSEAIRPISYKMMNIGVERKSGSFYSPINRDEIQRLENYYRNKAEYYAQQASKYLCENASDYPLYTNPGDGVDVIVPKSNQYKTSLFLGGKKGNYNSYYDDKEYKND